MKHTITIRESFELAGLKARASNADPSPIGAIWGRVFSEKAFEALQPLDANLIAVYAEYESDHSGPYTFFLGRRIAPGSPIPAGLERVQVGGGTFARFEAVGEVPDALIEAWSQIHKEPIARRYEEDYEIHSPKEPLRVQILVGI